MAEWNVLVAAVRPVSTWLEIEADTVEEAMESAKSLVASHGSEMGWIDEDELLDVEVTFVDYVGEESRD